jgi:hypothetical protein
MFVKPEGKRKNGRSRMRWMGGVEKDLRNLGGVNWKTGTRAGWLEKVFRAGHGPERLVVQ